MTDRASQPLAGVLIRIGLLLALVIMFVVEHAQGEWALRSRPVAGPTPASGQPQSLQR